MARKKEVVEEKPLYDLVDGEIIVSLVGGLGKSGQGGEF